MKELVLDGLVRRFEKKSSTMKTDRQDLEVKEAPRPCKGGLGSTLRSEEWWKDEIESCKPGGLDLQASSFFDGCLNRIRVEPSDNNSLYIDQGHAC
jgi:hypothetical protein